MLSRPLRKNWGERLTAKERAAIIERDGGKCCLCSVDCAAACEVDHIKPRRIGGDNAPSNLRTLCKPCHRKVSNAFFHKLRYRRLLENIGAPL